MTIKVEKYNKFIGGKVTETKTEQRNGIEVGIVEGYIATWDLDRGDFFGVQDRFVKGAFIESILDHVRRNRPIRLKDHHSRTVGGFPIEFVKEDERGLFGVGEINLEVQQGREAFSLAKQGILSDFSIGFSVDEFEMDQDIRTITKATIWEGSIVDEPMNPQANITQVKNYSVDDIKDWTERDFEKALRSGCQLSRDAARLWMKRMSEIKAPKVDPDHYSALLDEIESLSSVVKNR